MTEIIFDTKSPDAGTPECVCSLCGELITADDVPVRLWQGKAKYEARFHPTCGLKVIRNPDDYKAVCKD